MQVESKSNTGRSGPSGMDSERSSSSILTSGDDSVMPHAVESHVEQQYEMLMPILPHPSPYWRIPNATEAYRAAHRSPSGRHMAPPVATGPPSSGGPPVDKSPLGPAPAAPAAAHNAMAHSSANVFAVDRALLRRPSGAGSFHASAGDSGAVGDRVLTDDSGLQLLGTTITRTSEGDEQSTLAADDLAVRCSSSS